MKRDKKLDDIIRSFVPPALLERVLLTDKEQLASFGERREITVLFADLSGFTPLCERINAEDVMFLLNGLFERLVDVIEQYGGVVDKFLGDAVMVVFGSVIAHKDDPRRALLTTLGILDAVDEYNLSSFVQKLDAHIGVSIGINTGVAVAGLVGDNRHREYTVLGSTVNIAARLEQSADEGEILISEKTAESVGNEFVMRPRGKLKLKGVSKPITAYTLISTRHTQIPVESDMCLLEKKDAPARLAALLTNDTPKTVQLIGSPGSGKSFLLEWLHKKALEQGFVVVWVSAEEWRAKAGGLVPMEIINRLGGDAEAGEVFSSAKRLLEASGKALILIDNSDYLDRESLRFIEEVSTSVPIVLAGQTPIPFAEQIELAPLTRRETRVLLVSLLGTPAIPQPLLNYVFTTTNGITGHIIELVKYIREHGILSVEEGKVIYSIPPEGIPREMGGLMRSELDHLPADIREAVLRLSVLGDRFPKAILVELISEDKDTINKLVALRILRFFPGDNEILEFTSSSFRKEVYSTLLDVHRTQFHRDVAFALEGQGIGDIEVLAHHFFLSNEFKRAFRYHLLAAQKFLRAGEPDAAIELLNVCEQIANEHPDAVDDTNLFQLYTLRGEALWYLGDMDGVLRSNRRASRLARRLGDAVRFSDAMNRIAVAMDSLGYSNRAIRLYRRSLRALSDRDENDIRRLQLSCNIGALLADKGDFDGTMSIYKDAAPMVQRHPYHQIAGNLHTNIAWVKQRRGDLEGALSEYLHALRIDHRSRDIRGEGFDRLNLGVLLLKMGDWCRARRSLSEALRLLYKSGELRGRISALLAFGELLRRSGDVRRSIAIHTHCRTLCSEIDDPILTADAISELGLDAIAENRLNDAAELFSSAIDITIEFDDSEGTLKALEGLKSAAPDTAQKLFPKVNVLFRRAHRIFRDKLRSIMEN